MNNKIFFFEKYFKINIRELVLIQFIIEGYEGLATVTTTDRNKGIIKLSFCSDVINDVNKVIEAMERQYSVREINN